MRRQQKNTRKLLKFKIDAQKSEDCRSRILTIKNGSNPVFEPNILAGAARIELATPGFGDQCSTS